MSKSKTLDVYYKNMHVGKYLIPSSVSPCAGALGPLTVLSQASRISFTCSGGYMWCPTLMSVPAMILTML